MPGGEILFLKGDKGARFPDANSLFIDDEIPTFMDPATRPVDLERLRDEKGAALVIDTHYHVDHTRYNRLFPGAELAAHPADAPAIGSLDEMAKVVGTVDQPWVDIWKGVMRDWWGYREMEVARALEDGEEICLGANTLRIHHAPGHTPGHIVIEFVEKRAVYLADIDMGSFGPWYGNRASDIDSFLESIEMVRGLDADTWYTAHENGALEGDISERLDAFAHVVDERDARVVEFLKSPRDRGEIIDATLIYRKRWEPPDIFEFFEWMQVKKHLDRLERRGVVVREGDRWVVA